MLLTEDKLTRDIRNLKCAYATYVAKYSNLLSLGLTGQCNYCKLVVVKWYIKLLERFQEAGIICTQPPPCQLKFNTFTIDKYCYIDDGFHLFCVTEFGGARQIIPAFEGLAGSVVSFTETDVTIFQSANNSTTTGPYTYVDGVLTIDGIGNGVVTFSADCSTFTVTVAPVGIYPEVTVYFSQDVPKNPSDTTTTCKWASDCVTELETIEIIKHSFILLNIQCNC